MKLPLIIIFTFSIFYLALSQQICGIGAPNGCAFCSTISGLACTSCNSGFHFTNPSACLPCSIGATSCNSTSIECSSGYYNDTATTCSICGIGAATCTSVTNATSCLNGYVLSNSICISCSSGLSSLSINGIPGCLSCSMSATVLNCTSCGTASGYVLVGSKCISCNSEDNVAGTTTTGFIPNCATCTIKTTVITCTNCSTGYIFSPTQCNSCNNDNPIASPSMTNCASCTTNITCTSCNAGYFGASCLACPVNTTTCFSATIASACNIGYTIASSVCVACPIGCLTCGSTTTITTISSATCYSCSTGYYLTATGTCILGTTSDSYCANFMTPSICATCNSNAYQAIPAGCIPCSANCQNCTSAIACTSCASGYSLLNSNNTCFARNSKNTQILILSFSFFIIVTLFLA